MDIFPGVKRVFQGLCPGQMYYRMKINGLWRQPGMEQKTTALARKGYSVDRTKTKLSFMKILWPIFSLKPVLKISWCCLCCFRLPFSKEKSLNKKTKDRKKIWKERLRSNILNTKECIYVFYVQIIFRTFQNQFHVLWKIFVPRPKFN